MASSTGPGPGERAVAIHYHMFKNAGSSVDRALREAIGDGWRELEVPRGHQLGADGLRDFILADQGAVVISSHTASLPEPEIVGVRVLPIVFVRHPLDRLRSAYDFEHQQQTDTPGANAAKQYDLAGYLRWRLGRAETLRDHSATSFQARRLAVGSAGGSLLERALGAVDRLPFVGLVEAYDQSLAALEGQMSEQIGPIDLKTYHENIQRDGTATLDQRLSRMARDIGADLYATLVRANAEDLVVWDYVRARYLGG
jgi:hypothetical protein